MFHYIQYSIAKARVHVISPIGPASCRRIPVERSLHAVMHWDLRLY